MRVTLEIVRARRVVGAIVLAICIGAPIVEGFDRWDDTLHDGNDTEANLVIAALCVGLALSAVGIVVAWIRLFSSRCDRRFLLQMNRRVGDRVFAAPPSPASSPPIALRI
jgi:hypothetical protein